MNSAVQIYAEVPANMLFSMNLFSPELLILFYVLAWHTYEYGYVKHDLNWDIYIYIYAYAYILFLGKLYMFYGEELELLRNEMIL